MTPAPSSSHATETAQALGAPAKVKIWQLTATEWLICAVACVGFAFDTYTLLVLTLIVRPALNEMLPANSGPAVFNQWVGILFYVPAIAGGIFGLLGGYLIDLLGRRRILMWSILLYGVCTFATAYVTTPLEFLLLRGSVPTESSKEPVVASLENYVLLLLGTMGLEKVLQIDDSIRKRLHCDRPFCVPGFLVLSSLV